MNSEIAGQGSFGVVLNPSVPNIVDGESVAFPTNVTKIFFRKTNYNKTLKDSDRIKATVPSLYQPALRYVKQNYTINTLPVRSTVKSNLKGLFIKRGANPQNTLTMVHSPYLGYSFADIIDKPALHPYLRAVPYDILLREIKRNIQVLQDIRKANYIHGDVRETNVLFNFQTNRMTITDFDWMMPEQEFMQRFPAPFYSHPPEAMLLFPTEGVVFTQKYTVSFIPDAGIRRAVRFLLADDTRVEAELKALIDKMAKKIHFGRELAGTEADYKRDCYAAFMSYRKLYKDRVGQQDDLNTAIMVAGAIKQSFIETVDSYGFALSLFILLDGVVSERMKVSTIENDLFVNFVDTFLAEALSINITGRATVIRLAAIVAEAEKLLYESRLPKSRLPPSPPFLSLSPSKLPLPPSPVSSLSSLRDSSSKKRSKTSKSRY